MDTDDPNALSDIERRLFGWRPQTDKLDADAMLFAAGRVADRRARLVWSKLCGVLALLSVSLGVWGLHEHSERRALASRLHEDQLAAPQSPPAPVESLPESYTPSAIEQFSLRRRMEQDPNRWLVSPPSEGAPAVAPPEPTIFRAGQLIDQ